MVCSTQPYGNEVRYSSAPNSDPAIEGETRIESDREPGSTFAGNVRSNAAELPPPPAIRRAPATASLREC